ncbi:porin family protein [Chishuiella sp.]|uniref:porin family protein n=1 Tax=Chishuiella sp. TaxID=1969467 RepID=UPI0028B00FF5|nr:porin family protein [Chishuiella sp.]
MIVKRENIFKRNLILLLSFTLLLSVQKINAQTFLNSIKERISLGVKAEGNGTNFIIKNNPNLKSKIDFGGAIGTIIRFKLTENLAIQEDIMFVYNSSTIERNGVDDKFQYFGTEVPIYLMGQWKNNSDGRFFIGAGPYFGLGFSGKYKNDDIDVFKKYDGNKSEMKRISNGLAANIGYELSSGLQLNATYKYGFNSLNKDKNEYKMLPQSFSFGLGYSF